MREGPDRRGRKAADAPGSSAPRFCRQNGRRLARQGLPKDPVREPGRPEARRQAGRAPSRSSATAVFKICARRGLFAARRRAARTCADGRRPRQRLQDCGRRRPPLQDCQYAFPISAAHGFAPLTMPAASADVPPPSPRRRLAQLQGAAHAAGSLPSMSLADRGFQSRLPSPPSALPAPSRPRRAGLFARRRAPDARPFLRPRTRALPGTP